MDKIITLRVTKKIAQLLEKRKKKQTRSAFIRKAIQSYMSGDIDVVAVATYISEIKDLKIKLAPVGSNLNQLAYAFNTKRTLNFMETVKFLNALQVILSDVQQQNKKIIRALENHV